MIAGFGPDHPSWAVLKEKMESDIERARSLLETAGMTTAAAEFERGRIAGLRALIADVEASTQQQVVTPGYDV